MQPFPTPEALAAALDAAGHVVEDALATTLWLGADLGRPVLLEGEAGVGKTSVATALAQGLGAELVRLQCFEGLDLQQAVYEWDYARQILAIRVAETGDARAGQAMEQDLFSRRFLLERPLLRAITLPGPVVLLVDEIDRTDDAFEAFLLEVLGEFQITIPELGTVRAATRPYAILTSNATRELSDALRRRCLYHYVEFPSPERETAIVRKHLPEAADTLATQAVDFVQLLRREDLRKKPGVAETLDWVRALTRMRIKMLPEDPEKLLATLACVLKTREDRVHVDRGLTERLAARARGA